MVYKRGMVFLRTSEPIETNQKGFIARDRKISIIIPVWNEVCRLREGVYKLKRFLKKFDLDFEIIISEDGSTDGTDQIASELANSTVNIKHLHSDERLGKGKAVQRALRRAKGEIAIYTDVDLSTKLESMIKIIQAVRDGADIAIGSRLVKGSCVIRPFHRTIISRIYNLGVRMILRSPVHDHQCGFKAFRTSKVSSLLDAIEDNHWFWDTELIVRAIRRDYRIVEIPVKWIQGEKSKIHVWTDSGYMATKIFRLWRKLRTRKKTLREYKPSSDLEDTDPFFR